MYTNANGNHNSVFGFNSFYLGVGSNNVAVGSNSLNSLVNGNSNTSLGDASFTGIVSGNSNMCLGANSTLPSTTGSLDYRLSIQNSIYGINMSDMSSARVGVGVYPSPTTIASSVPIGTIAKLHVGGISGNLRIDDVKTVTTLPVSNPSGSGKYLFVDQNGFVAQAALPAAGGGVTSTCTSLNLLPKATSTGSLVCSQIYDDGSSVGIETTNFNYAGGAPVVINIPTAGAGTKFKLAVNGYISSTGYVALSDQRYKKDIKPILNSIEKIEKLNGYTYKWNDTRIDADKQNPYTQAGFLAQEVLEVLPEAVIKTEDGTYGLIYDAILPLLAEGIKEQQNIIKNQEDRITRLEQLLDLDARTNGVANSTINSNAYELLVYPNPIEGVSQVRYTLKNASGSNQLIITDLQGKLLQKFELVSNAKTGSIEIRNSDFKEAGMYLFSILSNQEETISKRVFVSK